MKPIHGKSIRNARFVVLAAVALAAAVEPLYGVTTNNLVWTGALGAAQREWSGAGNWSGGDAPTNPTPGRLTFENAGATNVIGAVNNVVEMDRTIGSLYYTNTGTSYHTTEIPSGSTLTVNGGHVLVGDQINGKTVKTTVTMSGGGTFAIDRPTAVLYVYNRSISSTGDGGTHMATLDLSALGAFRANVNHLRIGYGGGYACGTLRLSPDNLVIATNVYIGYYTGWNNLAGYLYLGQSNVFHVTRFDVGTMPGLGHVYFAAGLSGANVTVRGITGGNSRAEMDIGTLIFGGYTGNNAGGTVDMNGGRVDARLGNLRIGCNEYWGDGAPSVGALSFYDGTIDATTIPLAQSSVGPATGTITIGSNATLRASTITMAKVFDRSWTCTATINLNGGALEAKTIVIGTKGGAYNNQFAYLYFKGGTIRNLAGQNLTISGLTTFSVTGAAVSNTFDVAEGRTNTVNSAMTGTGGFTKTGGGVMRLNGTNTYSGATVITQGVLRTSHEKCFPTNSAVWIYTGAMNELAFAGTNTIGSLYIDGRFQGQGLYGAHNRSAVFTGTGKLLPLTYAPPEGTSVFIR